MQKLRQYVDLIKQFKVKRQEVDALLGNEETKIHRFFEGLATRRWKDELAIVQELYDSTCDVKHAPYRALKAELKRKLKNMLFLIDFKQPDILNDIQQAYYEGLRTEGAIKILFGRLKTDAGIDLCQHLLDIALKFELTESILLSAKQLRNHYRHRQPNQKKYEYYRNLHTQYFEIYYAENLAEEFYIDILGYYVNNRSTKKWVQPLVQDYVSQLMPYKDKVDTFIFLKFFGHLELMVHMSVNDYTSTLMVCNEYIAKLENKSFLHQASLIMLYHQKIMCHLMLREHDEGWKAIQKMANWVIYGSQNWFKDRTLLIQFCLHTNRNKEAMQACIEAIKHEDFKNQAKDIQEELIIYQAYIQWLIAVGKLQPNQIENEQIGSFRLNGFLNKIPTFTQDKRGLNVPILMLQILWTISQKDYNGFTDRLEAVKQYKTRHLRDDPNSRTNLLIKLLTTVPELNYELKKIKKQTNKTYNTLVDTTYDLKDETHEIEAFPYDMYWLHFLKYL